MPIIALEQFGIQYFLGRYLHCLMAGSVFLDDFQQKQDVYKRQLEYQRSPVRRIYVGYISFSRQRRRIFPSVLDAQAALFAKGWNPDKFQIVEEETNPKSEIQ